MNSIKRLAGQTIIYGMGTIVPRFLNYLLLTPFYTRLFEKGEYGIVTELYAYVALLLVLLTYGMETTSFRFSESHPDSRKVFRNAQTSILITSGLFLAGVGFLTDSIAQILRYQANPEFIVWMALIVATDAFMAIPFARLRQQNKAWRFSIFKFVSITINILLNLLFLVYLPKWYGEGSDSLLVRYYNPEIGVGYAFIANLISVFITLALLLPDIFRIGLGLSMQLIKKMYSYAWPLLIIGIAGMINEVADKAMLKYLLVAPKGIDQHKYAMEQIGIYGANTKIAVLMSIFIQMFKFAAEPFFFAQYKEKGANTTYALVMKYFVIFCVFIFLMVTLFIDLVKFFIDEKFHDGLHVVPIILLGYMFLGIFYNLSVWYKLKDVTRLGAVIAVIGASITILVNMIFVPHHGYVASAWGHIGCYFAMMVISFLWGKKYMPIDYQVVRLIGYIAFGIVILIMYRFFSEMFNHWMVGSGLLFLFLVCTSFLEYKEFKQVTKS
jgi:O-antigen/teichoic acid export membrane protein